MAEAVSALQHAERVTTPDEPLLAVDNLSISFQTDSGPVTVVSDVGFALRAGEVHHWGR